MVNLVTDWHSKQKGMLHEFSVFMKLISFEV